jgi:hypothetical protein
MGCEDGPAPLVEVLAGLYPTGEAQGREAERFIPEISFPRVSCLPSAAAAVSSRESRPRATPPGRSDERLRRGPPATAGSRQTGLPGSHDPLQMARLRRLAGADGCRHRPLAEALPF